MAAPRWIELQQARSWADLVSPGRQLEPRRALRAMSERDGHARHERVRREYEVHVLACLSVAKHFRGKPHGFDRRYVADIERGPVREVEFNHRHVLWMTVARRADAVRQHLLEE